MKSNKSNKSNKSSNSNKSNNYPRSLSKENQPKKNMDYDQFVTVTFVTNVTDRVRAWLYFNPHQTIKQIANAIDENPANVKTEVTQRHKDSFKHTGKSGKEHIYDLSQADIDLISTKITNYQNQEKRQSEKAQVQQSKQQEQDERKNLIKTFFSNKKNYEVIGKNLFLDLKLLQEQEPEIFGRLENQPEKTIQEIELSLDDLDLGLKLRFKNLEVVQKNTIENLRAKHLNQLFVLEVKSTSLSDVRPKVIQANFECPACGTIISVLQMEKKFKEPLRCSCGRRGGFLELSKEMIDFAEVSLQDLQEKSESYTVKDVRAYIQEENTHPQELKKFTPGNDLKVLGILIPYQKVLSTGAISTMMSYIFKILESQLFEPEISLDDFSDEELKQFKKLSSKINRKGLSELTTSIAPEVYGHEKFKEALCLQAVSPKNTQRNKKTPNTKPNILTIGDPGVAKSIMMRFMQGITQGSMYISGGGSTHVGLTATVEKQQEGWILKPGAMGLAKEMCFIDEFNLIPEEDRPKLQECMSEGRITINKASIHSQLNVSCGVCASANPKDGCFNPYDSNLISQFNLYPPILNRFDFIFAIQDLQNPEIDEEIAKRMIERENDKIKPSYETDFLKKFLLYIKNQPQPVLTKQVSEQIPKLYSSIRKNHNGKKKVNARFVEILVRNAKAHARFRQSEKVEKKDLKAILEILKESHLKLNILTEEDSI